MLFNSWSYIIFIVISIPLSYVLHGKFRLLILLGLSLLFYAMWRVDFTFLMLGSAFLDFFVAKKIYKSQSKKAKLSWLLVSLFVNLGLLVFFKYAYFLDDNLRLVNATLGYDYQGLKSFPFSIILPLGISFYTFQTISYSVDVYRGVEKPVDNFVLFATYVTFWPQLVAGPILRVSEVIPQLQSQQIFSWQNFNQGSWRILVGLFKKVVLADNVTSLVDEGFLTNSDFLSAWDVWVVTILFGFQIYFDFAGYSDIAIGTAQMMGFKFPENFNWPYMATNPKEFWRRWHISLSSWIRDYLYLPIMGAKVKNESKGGIDIEIDKSKRNERPVMALFITWFIMGLWHGAGWNFAIWGIYHALIIFLFRKVKGLNETLSRRALVSWLITFLLMMLSWIPFRATSVQQTIDLFAIIINPFKYLFVNRQFHISYYFYAGLLLSVMIIAYLLKETKLIQKNESVLKGIAIPGMVFLIIVYMQQVVQFIYFQF